MFDRGCCDFERLFRITQYTAHVVIRAKMSIQILKYDSDLSFNFKNMKKQTEYGDSIFSNKKLFLILCAISKSINANMNSFF